jgi:cytochrome c551/c552
MVRTRTLQLAAVAALTYAIAGCATTPTPVAGAEMGGRPVDATLADKGMVVWREKGCFACHGFGRVLAGPDLAGVMERRDHDWLRKWLKETDTMLQNDPQAVAMLKDWTGVKMPNMKLSDAQIDALFHYMAQESARVRSGE